MLEGMSTQLSRTMGQARSHAPRPSGLGEGDLGLLMAQAKEAFSRIPKEILELGEIFTQAGEEISLVGETQPGTSAASSAPSVAGAGTLSSK